MNNEINTNESNSTDLSDLDDFLDNGQTTPKAQTLELDEDDNEFFELGVDNSASDDPFGEDIDASWNETDSAEQNTAPERKDEPIQELDEFNDFSDFTDIHDESQSDFDDSPSENSALALDDLDDLFIETTTEADSSIDEIFGSDTEPKVQKVACEDEPESDFDDEIDSIDFEESAESNERDSEAPTSGLTELDDFNFEDEPQAQSNDSTTQEDEFSFDDEPQAQSSDSVADSDEFSFEDEPTTQEDEFSFDDEPNASPASFTNPTDDFGFGDEQAAPVDEFGFGENSPETQVKAMSEKNTQPSQKKKGAKKSSGENTNMNTNSNDDQLLSTLVHEPSQEPRKKSSGIGIIAAVLVSSIVSAGSILGYQEFLAPKDIVTSERLEHAVDRVTLEVSNEIIKSNTLVYEDVIKRLESAGLLSNDQISLSEISNSAAHAVKVAENISRKTDKRLDHLTHTQKVIREDLNDSSLVMSKVQKQVRKALVESGKVDKLLKSIYAVKVNSDKTTSAILKRIDEVEKELAQGTTYDSAELLALRNDVADLLTKSDDLENLSTEVKEIRREIKDSIRSAPSSSKGTNKVQEALGLTSTGINVVKGGLPELEVKGVINGTALIVTPSDSGNKNVLGYVVGGRLEGYGKILKINQADNSILTEKGYVKKTPNSK